MQVTPDQSDKDSRPLLNGSTEVPVPQQSPIQINNSNTNNTNNSSSNNSQNNDVNPFLTANTSNVSNVPQKDLIDWLDTLPSTASNNNQPPVIFDPFSEIDKLILGTDNTNSNSSNQSNKPASPQPTAYNTNNSPVNQQNNNTPKKSKILISEESEAEIQNILEIQKQEALKYLAQQQSNSNQPKTSPAPVQNTNNNKNMVPCPICSKKFPQEQIEAHVNVCLDGGEESEPPVQHPVQPLPQKNNNLKSSVEIANELATVEAQIKILEELNRKKAQEEQDRLLAEKLMKELEKSESSPPPKSPPSTNNTNNANNANNSPRQQPNNMKMTDEELAILLMRQEEEEFKKKQKEKEEADKKLAEAIMQREKQEEEERKKKQEWEDTLNLIKMQAKQEADAQLARLLREKEELQAQLQDLSVNSTDEKHVALSLAEVETPSYWQNQVSNHQMFDVKSGTEEYKKVIAAFKQGMPSAKVVRIERNQNKTLWTWYFLQRQMVAAGNGDDPNEKKLWHGSRNDAYETILKEGFDHRVANLGGAIGAGIYFGVSSGTSNGYVVSSNWRNTKKMLYCRVTLGAVGQGQSGLRRPPEKSKGKLYDSVGDHHTMFVVFDNHQAYPEYVIHYQ